MSQVTSLGYIGIEASDLQAWKKLLVNILGLQLSFENDKKLSFRMDNYAQRVVITEGPRDDLIISGWEVASENELDALVEKLRNNNVEVTAASMDLCADRKVEKLFLCNDPDGNQVEIYCGPLLTNAQFQSSCLRSSFDTTDKGLGHFFLVAKNNRKVIEDFYINLLGMKVSDYIREEIAPGMVADAIFLHCNPRHHSMATALFPTPKNIHHLMFQVKDIGDVGEAYDRAIANNCEFEMTLGMHPNDKMFSFYVKTPSGFSIEFGYGGIEIDDNVWKIKSYDVLSEWGHHPPAVAPAL